MNYSFKVLLFLCICAPAYAEIGCMDNSYHVQQDYDYKQYHYVRCTCPCKQYQHYMSKGYRCSKCGHAHDPHLAAVVRNSYTAAGSLEYEPVNLRLFCAWPKKSRKIASTTKRISRNH